MHALVIPTDAPAVEGPQQGRWSYDEWENLPNDGNRYEVVDGVLYMSTSPSFFHQWIALRFVEHIGIPAKQQGLAIPALGPVGVLMARDLAVQPDFVLVLSSHAGIIHDRRIRGVPDAIVEVLSPGNAAYDERVKRRAYADAGLPEYVIADPATRTLRHYRLEQPGRYAQARVLQEQDEFNFDCLPAIRVRVADLFAGSPDTTL